MLALDRRNLLSGMAMTGLALPASPLMANPRSAWTYDPEDIEGLVRAYAKIAGATDERQLYLQYSGVIASVIPNERPKPLFRMKGLVRQRWKPNGDNTFSGANYDHGLFCDYETGKVMTSYDNPFTGETNEPLHYNSGVIQYTVGSGEGQNNPANKQWNVTGSQVSISTDSYGKTFKNPVDPKIFPKASTGEVLDSSWRSIYFANAYDVADPDLPGVDASHNWMYITNFPAWMKMGRSPGFVVWHWTGTKFLDEEGIDPYILEEIEKRIPGFLTVEKPWELHSDGWTQYARERKPEAGN